MTVSSPPGRDRHHVVVIGSGFGGLFAAQALDVDGVEVTMISRTTHHLFQPLLYQVATGILSEGEIAPSTRDVLKRQRNARVVVGEVTGIDLADRTVTSDAFGTTRVTPYDSLIVAAGAHTSYFGNDQWAEHAPGLKTIEDALEVRSRIFGAFEMAEVETDPAARAAWLTFVVVGAGPTGVEMVGQISEAANRTLRDNFRSIDPASARIILLDAAGAVLGTFGEHLSGKAAATLDGLGIEVKLHAKVVGVDAGGVDLSTADGQGERIDARTVVWAAGVAASGLGRHLAEQVGLQVDRAGRVPVNEDLTLPGHPEVFVVGDMATLKDYPGVSQFAMQGARYAARTIIGRRHGAVDTRPFRYRDKGSMATISRFQAIASIGRHARFSGFTAWVLWLAVHLFYLVGFKNRVSALAHWAVTFMSNSRSERVVTYPPGIGRPGSGPRARPSADDPTTGHGLTQHTSMAPPPRTADPVRGAPPPGDVPGRARPAG